MTPPKSQKKVVTVREHSRHVPVTSKNPTGTTIVDRHLRRISGTFLNSEEIENVIKNYPLKGIAFPTPNDLTYPDGNAYDTAIAIWTDYFGKIFKSQPKIEADVVKALIASESGFRVDPPENRTAFGIAQITKQTFKAIQDPKGEATEFIFTQVRQKDLKDPKIAIPMSVRWLYVKQKLAKSKLGHWPDHEELILEYKGMLKSNTPLKNQALKTFRKKYAQLKNR